MDNWLSDLVTSAGFIKAVVLIGILIFLRFFGAIIIDRSVRHVIRQDESSSAKAEKAREDTLIAILKAILRVCLWVFGIMLVLAQIGVNVGPLIAGASIAGIAIGFGAQAIVKDFVSGLFIILENQYRIGDVVSVCGITGTVESITIRQTVLRSTDGAKHYVPNGQITTTSNLTMDYSRLNMSLLVAYETDATKVQKIIDKLGQEIAKDPDWQDEIIEAPAFVRISSFEGSGLEITINGKVKPGSQWAIGGEFRQRLLLALRQAKIKLGRQLLFDQS